MRGLGFDGSIVFGRAILDQMRQAMKKNERKKKTPVKRFLTHPDHGPLTQTIGFCLAMRHANGTI